MHSQDGSFAWTSRNVVSAGENIAIQHNLARYAGININTAEAALAADGTFASDVPTLSIPQPPAAAISVTVTPVPVTQVSATQVPIAYAPAAHVSVIQGSAETSNAIPLDIMDTFQWQSYSVKRGDSVSTIAAAFSVSMDAIIASNGIINARALREGETLRIPNMDGIPHTVQRGDNLSTISRSFGVPLEAILDANDIRSDVIHPGATLFIPGARMNRDALRRVLGEHLFTHPIKGARLTSPFGWRNDPFTGVRRHHAAVDLAAPHGTAVLSAQDGNVAEIGYDRVFGNFVIISHDGDFQTLYAHLHTVTARRGETVKQGARIGTVGSTGLSTGPHLHFGIYKNNRAVNPLDFLNSRS